MTGERPLRTRGRRSSAWRRAGCSTAVQGKDTAVLQPQTRRARVTLTLRDPRKRPRSAWKNLAHTQDSKESGDPIEIIVRWQMRHRGWGKSLAQHPSATMSLCLFSNQLLLLAAITHLLTPSIYYYKCQRCPSFYFSIFLGKDVVSLSSLWPCYSAVPSLTERPSFCQRLSPILPPIFFVFFLGLLHPHLPLFLFRSWQLRSAGRAACLLRGEVEKRGAENKEQDRRRISPHLSACLLVVFWLTLSVWSLEFSFQFPSSDVKEMAHCKAGSIIDKRQRTLYIFFLNIHPSSWRVLLHMRRQ